MRADERLGSEQFLAFRRIDGAKRLKLAERLYWSARKIKAAGIRNQHPDWDEDRVAVKSDAFSRMPEPELFLFFVKPLNRSQIPYIIGGSVAAIFYGEPA